MSTFSLQIVTPDGEYFDGQAEKLVVRTATGDVCILPQHCDFVAPLGMGEAQVFADGAVRRAACIGGMLAVTAGAVRLVPTTFEWSDEIDSERADRAAARAQEILAQNKVSRKEAELAKAHLRRALVRSSVAKRR